jgi:hypothetical protein
MMYEAIGGYLPVFDRFPIFRQTENPLLQSQHWDLSDQ